MNAADNGIIAAKNHFNCSVADAIYRKKKFLSKLQHTDNTLLAMFCSNMAAEIAKLPL